MFLMEIQLPEEKFSIPNAQLVMLLKEITKLLLPPLLEESSEDPPDLLDLNIGKLTI
jgi:hypothetical protein